jgi:potassium/hydrogen antiporter
LAVFLQLALGGLLGLLFGKIGELIINKIQLDYEGLYIVLVIAMMFFTFSFTDFIGGNGFLAVYLSAVYLGNQELIHKKKILKSFDSFAWLMQIVLFLTLGLLVYPSHIIPVVSIGLIISLFLMFVARPLSVFISLLPFKEPFRHKILFSWVGLRGAVPIVFATYPLLAGAEQANMIFDVVFFVSITSVLIQGTTLTKVAGWLKLTLPEEMKKVTKKDMEFTEGMKSLLTEIVIPENSPVAGKQIVHLGLPPTTLITFILRGKDYITPGGATVIEENDKLFVLSENKDSLSEVFKCLELNKINVSFPFF